MKRVEFGIGLTFRADHSRIPEVEDKIRLALARAGQMFGGANLLRGEGVWRDPRGNIVVEGSATFVTIVPNIIRVEGFALFLTELFEQEAVIVSVSDVESTLVARLERAA